MNGYVAHNRACDKHERYHNEHRGKLNTLSGHPTIGVTNIQWGNVAIEQRSGHSLLSFRNHYNLWKVVDLQVVSIKNSKISEPMIHCPRTMTPSTRADVPKRMRVYPNATICQLINPYWDLVATLPFPYCSNISHAHVQHKSEGCSLAEVEISCSGNLQTGKFRNNLPKFSWVIHISRFLDLKCTEDLFASWAYTSCQTGKRSLTVLISGKSCISELGWALETSSRGEDVAKNSGHLLLDTSI